MGHYMIDGVDYPAYEENPEGRDQCDLLWEKLVKEAINDPVCRAVVDLERHGKVSREEAVLRGFFALFADNVELRRNLIYYLEHRAVPVIKMPS